jgi:hypothetical protein
MVAILFSSQSGNSRDQPLPASKKAHVSPRHLFGMIRVFIRRGSPTTRYHLNP